MISRITLNDTGEWEEAGKSLLGSVDGAIAYIDIDHDGNYIGGAFVIDGQCVELPTRALYAIYRAFSEGEVLGFGEASF